MNHQITAADDLLNPDGTLKHRGWCRHPRLSYRRDAVMVPFPLGKSGMPASSAVGDVVFYAGRLTGGVVLDGGTRLAVNDFFGFAEKVVNRW